MLIAIVPVYLGERVLDLVLSSIRHLVVCDRVDIHHAVERQLTGEAHRYTLCFEQDVFFVDPIGYSDLVAFGGQLQGSALEQVNNITPVGCKVDCVFRIDRIFVVALDQPEYVAHIRHELFVLCKPIAGYEQYIAQVAAFPEKSFGLIVVRVDHVSQIAWNGVSDLHRVEAFDIICFCADRVHDAL